MAAEAECEAGGPPIGGGCCSLLGGQRGASSSSRPRRRGPRRSTGAIGLARPEPYSLRGAGRKLIRFCGNAVGARRIPEEVTQPSCLPTLI